MILEVAHQFFLIRVDRHNRLACGQECLGLHIEVLKLRVAIWVRSAFPHLVVRLQTISEGVQQLAHQLMVDLVVHSLQFLGQLAHTFARLAE